MRASLQAFSRFTSVLALPFTLALVGVIGACGDSSASGGSGGSGAGGSGGAGAGPTCLGEDQCYDTAQCFEAPTEAPSFKDDVLPIFEGSCALSKACHGDPSSPTGSAGYRPYLGEVNQQTTPSDIPKIRSLIVGVPSYRAPTMPIVDPSSPETSFLLHKIDGDLSCAELVCEGDDCGKQMPGKTLLDPATRDVIRAWIASGAGDT